MTLVYLVIGWLVGIVAVALRSSLGGLWPALVIAGFLLALMMRRDSNLRQIGLVFIAAGLGMWRYNLAQPQFTPDDLATYNDQGNAAMMGIVVDAPDVRDTKINLRVDVQSIQVSNKPQQAVHGLALVSAQRFGSYAYGDKIRIQGAPVTPPTFDSFSYRDYLGRSGVYTFIPYSRITVLDHGQGSPLLAALFDVRDRSHQMITKLLPSPQSALLTAVLLGDPRDLPPDVTDAFNVTGTSHIIAISGLKLAIITGLLSALIGRKMDKRLAAVLLIAGIGGYTIFVGASASVVRAAIMAVLAIVAQRFGRQSYGLTALAAAVFIMTAINPDILFDIGLLMSAGATLGLILYMPSLTAFTERVIGRLFTAETAQRLIEIITDAFLITIAVQLTTLPIIFVAFGNFSLVSFLANALVFPVQAPMMILGMLAIVAGAIWFPAGQLIAWTAGLPLSYTLGIIRAIANASGPSTFPPPDPALVIMYYVVLFGMTIMLSQPPETRRRIVQLASTPAVGVAGLAVAAILWAIVISRPDGKLHVWFLAVGSGNAVLIQSPGGAHLLIDGGSNPTQLQSAIGDRLPFYKRTLDVLFVTQPRPGTISALPPLFGHYSVQSAVTNGQSAADSQYQALTSAMQQSQTRVVTAVAGYTVKTGDGVTLDVLNPAQIPTDPNVKPGDAPLLLRLTYGDASFLLTTDLTEKGVKDALATGNITQSTVLQLASNGADKQNPDELIKAVAPQVAVVEAEQGNKSAGPASTVLDRLRAIPVYRTDLQGTIEVATDGKQLWISTGH